MNPRRPQARWTALLAAIATLAALTIPLTGTALGGHHKEHDLDCRKEKDTLSTAKTTTITCVVSSDREDPTRVDLDVRGAHTQDFTENCTTPAGGGNCNVQFQYSPNTTGRDRVIAWINDGGTDEPISEPLDPLTRSQLSHNDTDVMLRNWFVPGNLLSCTPLGAPSGLVSVRCHATTQAGGNVSEVVVDAEKTGGVNNPDGAKAPADVNNACRTGADGTCVVRLPATQGKPGQGRVCLWLDYNFNSAFNNGGKQFDGGHCGSGIGDDYTDVVSVTWSPQTFRSRSAITIRHLARGRRHAFTGSVGSAARGTCRGRRVVLVKKVTRGRDLVVGRKLTSRRGTWTVRHRRGGGGRYYASVKRAVRVLRSGDRRICGADSSRRIRVGR